MAENLFIGLNTIHLPCVDSTNNYARELVHDKMPIEGTLIIADEQTIGKGQRENSWVSEAKMNLTGSYILNPVFLAAQNQFFLSVVVALAVSDLVSLFLANEESVKIKWPNDILVNNQKIAGILIENTLQGAHIEASIVGIGLNVNQIEFQNELNATSLKLISAKSFELKTVIQQLNKTLEQYYLRLKAGRKTELLALMNQRLWQGGNWIQLKLNGE
ncbi:biotin--[acetyl-CoA-carboxylase] ligase, partial [Bacteroidota bacterium]